MSIKILHMQPATSANQIALLYYRTLKEMKDPRAYKMERRNGSHTYYTYHMHFYEYIAESRA